MDHLTTVGRSQIAIENGGEVLELDQAIFTSVRTPMGAGYRIVACSPGVRPEEKQAVTTKSPSHEGLCDKDESATGLAFFPVENGRFCVSLSCAAGKEPSGRGGYRVYTQAVFVTSEQLDLFDNDPIRLAHTLCEQGLADVVLKPSPTLDTLKLRVPKDIQLYSCDEALDEGERPWLIYLLGEFLATQTLVLAGGFESTPADSPGQREKATQTAPNAERIIETVLWAMPRSMRPTLSFSIGIRYATSRAHRLNLVWGELTSTKRLIAGQSIIYVQPATTKVPEARIGPWLNMVERFWSNRHRRELTRFLRRRMDDTSVAGLNSTASLRLLLNDLPGYDLNELLGVLRNNSVELVGDGLDVRLRRAIVRAASGRVGRMLEQNPPEPGGEIEKEVVRTMRLVPERFWSLLGRVLLQQLRGREHGGSSTNSDGEPEKPEELEPTIRQRNIRDDALPLASKPDTSPPVLGFKPRSSTNLDWLMQPIPKFGQSSADKMGKNHPPA
jgi:hypothetical protein